MPALPRFVRVGRGARRRGASLLASMFAVGCLTEAVWFGAQSWQGDQADSSQTTVFDGTTMAGSLDLTGGAIEYPLAAMVIDGDPLARGIHDQPVAR